MNIDAFIFNDELDLLEIRIETLKHVVDKFVAVECGTTFSGMPKPLHLAANIMRFPSNLVHVISSAYDVPTCDGGATSPWSREMTQREEIRNVLRRDEVNADDVITVSDVDEIPNPDVYDKFRKMMVPVASLDMILSYWYLNCRTPSGFCSRARIMSGAHLLENPLHTVRFLKKPSRSIYPAGWHFSWSGSTERLVDKTRSYSHCDDFFVPGLRELISQGKRPGLDAHCSEFPAGLVARCDIDESFPKCVQERQSEWKEKGLIL